MVKTNSTCGISILPNKNPIFKIEQKTFCQKFFGIDRGDFLPIPKLFIANINFI
ncbi:MAG: hypothetical protein K2P17_00665 [Helicobacteraceae bacterium]|nr:hypothetical protein [Helicobacteraceae bacterium]